MKQLVTIALLLACIVPCGAQEAKEEPKAAAAPEAKTVSGGKFNRLRLDKGRVVKFNIETGALESITGGFDITVLSEKAGEGEVRLRGSSMQASGQSADGKGPEQIILEGDVVIDHPKANITAEKAEWNFAKNSLVFTGNPILNTDQVKGWRASRMELNMETGVFTSTDSQAAEVMMQRGEGSGEAASGGATAVLAVADVKDWPGLLTKIKAQGQAAEASPGKQLLSLLDAKTREFFGALATDKAPGEKLQAQIVARLNSVLNSPRFYNADAWNGITLPAEAQELVKKDLSSLSKPNLLKLNRMLLVAAYPNEIAAKN